MIIETGTQYSTQILNLSNPTFQKIRQVSNDCIKRLSNPERNDLYNSLGRGTNVLSSEDQLCQYLWSFGNMHEKKVQTILNNVDVNKFRNKKVKIIDWGCGQGLATVCFFDFMKSHNLDIDIQKIILIEASEYAIKRASLHILSYINDESKISTINKYLDEVEAEEIQSLDELTIHFFSNILDIPQIDLQKLSQKIGNDSFGEHYVFCLGPLNTGYRRIDTFTRYFEKKEILYSLEHGEREDKKYTAKYLTFKFDGNKINIISYFPDVQFNASYQLDCVRKRISKDKFANFNSFELSAPFDIGASVYDDVNPILAVLNNLITRGLPTKASPYIEDVFKSLGNNRLADDLGSIKYDRELECFDIESLASQTDFSERDIENIQLALSPIAVSWIQKTVIEAMLTKRISIKEEWNVIVIERDLPCAYIAFEDLRQMFNHLTALSQKYDNLKFPTVNLKVVSNKYFCKSPLHLGPIYEYTNELRRIAYDMVIDISVLQKSDEKRNTFSEYTCKHNCYFNIRRANETHYESCIYTTDRIDYKPLVTRNNSGGYDDLAVEKSHLVYFLNLLFRKENFRSGQLPIMSRALQNKSVIGLLPTGGGKSITYQLSAMLQPGITLVIDPLRSLMKDQYDGLIKNGIDNCTYINATLDREEKEKNAERIEKSQIQIAFISPERLAIYSFRERLKNMRELGVYFAYGVIDEVHCVSEWGHDFRFVYLHLGRNLYNYVLPKQSKQNNHITLFGLTATASFDVLADVERELSGDGMFQLDSDTIVRDENTNRLELQYKIEKVPIEFMVDEKFKPLFNGCPPAYKLDEDKGQKKNYLKKLIEQIPNYLNELQTTESIERIKKQFNLRQGTDLVLDNNLTTQIPESFILKKDYYNQAGIVFCPHKRKTDISVFENLSKIKDTGVDVGFFVGSGDELNPEETDQKSFANLDKFINNEQSIMVATKAFGMGIDKPNVRFTINMNYSSSLESFVQEAGRGGRDKKMSLAVIMLSDYKLLRVNKFCSCTRREIFQIRDKWFKEADFWILLEKLNLTKEEIGEDYIDVFSPEKDLTKIVCDVCNTRFEFNRCNVSCENHFNDRNCNCSQPCQRVNSCQLLKLPNRAYDVNYEKNMISILKSANIDLSKINFRYLNTDYRTNQFFYDNSFKGSQAETFVMNEILSNREIDYFVGNDSEYKMHESATTIKFLDLILSKEPGTAIVAFIPANSIGEYFGEKVIIERIIKESISRQYLIRHNNTKERELVDEKDVKVLYEKADFEKAIYRMCNINLIDDFLQDYANNRFRIVAIRKKDGEYFQGLKSFLMRYFSEERADEEMIKVKEYREDNEVNKCLGYLTEFIYDKIAVKRKRAIDDIRTFCIQGAYSDKDWKEANEDLKDFIFYYFNSKYARQGYCINDEKSKPYSLLEDTDSGKRHDWEKVVIKYIKVIEPEQLEIGSVPIDNIKHLQGAVRLIRRSLTGENPALSLLNAFCLCYLGTNNNDTLEEELQNSYIDGYISFYNDDKSTFYERIKQYDKYILQHTKIKKEQIEYWNALAELDIHNKWTFDFKDKYTK